MASSTGQRTDLQPAEAPHYDRVAIEYERHYDDPCCQRYRQRFIDAPLLDGLDLYEP